MVSSIILILPEKLTKNMEGIEGDENGLVIVMAIHERSINESVRLGNEKRKYSNRITYIIA